MQEKLPEKILNFIIHHSTCATIVIDKEGRIIMSNKEHEKLSGIPTEESPNLTVYDMLERKIIDVSATFRVLKSKTPLVLEQTSVTKTGKTYHLMVHSIPYMDDCGNVLYVISYLYDISEKNKLLEQLKSREETIEFILKKFSNSNDSNIIYKSTEMAKLMEKSAIIASTNSTVLIQGESGVGKSLLVKYLHNCSERKNKPFLSINCGAIPASLIESELFGYERGAFTGASEKGKKGIFEYANKGTLFLDEIGDMPYDLQVKLLRVIQDGEFFRIGGTAPIQVDVRIIAATNANLPEMIAHKTFRQDLYYRLNVLTLTIPPLRKRRADIPVLIEHFREKINIKYHLAKSFTPRAVKLLSGLDLYGNVRELESIIERSMLFSAESKIDIGDLSLEIEDESAHGKEDVDIMDKTYQQLMGDAEIQVLRKAKLLYKTTTEIGQQLGLDQSTVSRKLKKYGL